jgi:hypothetical protein
VPRVVIQPASAEAVIGRSATLSATISGTAPMTFQWYEGSRLDTSRPVTKATTASFTTDPLFAPTSFWLRARNECGEIDTAAADVAVVSNCTPPVITSHPQNQTVAPGGSTILSVGANGPSLQYRWYQGQVFDFTKPVGVSAPSLATPAITEPTEFWVEISNPCGTVNSVSATITPANGRRRAAGR